MLSSKLVEIIFLARKKVHIGLIFSNINFLKNLKILMPN